MPQFQDHFSERADSYARHRPSYPVGLVDFFARLSPRRDLAWDCGCGSGQLSVVLASRFERVIATDASAEQIANAEPHPRVTYHRARVEESGLQSGAVDLAVAAQAAHWFDLAAYYAEVRRVTRAGSIVALVTYGNPIIDDEVDPIISHFYSEVLGPYWPPERRHVESGYRSLPFPFDEIEAPKLDLLVRWTLADLIGYVETWSALRELEKAAGRAPKETFHRDLARMWGAGDTVRSVRWPLSLRVGRRSASLSANDPLR